MEVGDVWKRDATSLTKSFGKSQNMLWIHLLYKLCMLYYNTIVLHIITFFDSKIQDEVIHVHKRTPNCTLVENQWLPSFQ